MYHLGRRGKKEPTVSGKLEGLVDWNVVGLQGFFHTLDPGLPWSCSRLVSWYSFVVRSTGKLIRCHACQMSKPFDCLPLNVVEDRCFSHHFSDPGVSDLIPSGLVDGPPQASHLASGYLAFQTFGQGPCLALVGQGGGEDGVNEFGFGLNGNVGMFEEWGKLVTDVVGLLYVAKYVMTIK